MAIWQVNCYIIPNKNAILFSNTEDERILCWGKQNQNIEKIDFIKKEKSWSNEISQYGKDSETCIEFLYENDILQEINCRLDVRSLSKKVLQSILDYTEKIDGLILYENKIYSPNIVEIIELIKKSRANKFCENPEKFLIENFDKNNSCT